MSAQPPVALTIAGSDSGGGAGLQADLKTFAALGVFGTTAVTAVTAQNTCGVESVHHVPVGVVLQQVLSVVRDLPVVTVKTGMLGTADVVAAVSELAHGGLLPRLVVDPVMVASSGARLLDPGAEVEYLQGLLSAAEVLTPNVDEAGVLLGSPITDLPAQHDAARALGAIGPTVVVVKGGHAVRGTEDHAVDVVWDGRTTYELAAPRVDTHNQHGTGCTFSAALVAGLARGLAMDDALWRAKEYVHGALRASASWRLGSGCGPVDHQFVVSGPPASATAPS